MFPENAVSDERKVSAPVFVESMLKFDGNPSKKYSG